jgi:tRNA(Ile)-lysidine synthase
MTRSHPPTLITLTKRALRDDALVPRGSRVLVAVSGGPDSMALLDVLARLRTPCGFDVVAHGVDHGLRAEAAAELDRTDAFARVVGVSFARTTLAVARGGDLMARARTARYGALAEAARAAGADRIATAHHADDRAETLVMRLLRGAGPAGLAVLPPRAVLPTAAGEAVLVRPFLRARKAAILAHLARHGVPFAEDPSNSDPRFLRARVRADVLPRLEALSPAIVEHLGFLADELGRLTNGMDAPPLPRRTRLALAALERDRSPKTRVSLPGGLVAAWDRTKAQWVVGASSPSSPSSHSRGPPKGKE